MLVYQVVYQLKTVRYHYMAQFNKVYHYPGFVCLARFSLLDLCRYHTLIESWVSQLSNGVSTICNGYLVIKLCLLYWGKVREKIDFLDWHSCTPPRIAHVFSMYVALYWTETRSLPRGWNFVNSLRRRWRDPRLDPNIPSEGMFDE